jgi:tRNA(Arg) A34 adenosine deaminase TadA
MENNHELFMMEALKLASKNMEKRNGGPFGALITKDGEIVASGSNDVIRTNDPTNHAEIVAIREACRKLETYHLDGCIMYASCEPCPMCLGAIYWSRIERLFFAATRDDAANIGYADDHIYREFSLDFDERSILTTQILHDKGKEVFNRWRELGLNILY